MKRNLTLSIAGAFALMYSVNAFSNGNRPPLNPISGNSGIFFTENKGQILDQLLNENNSVLFAGKANELNFHLKKNGISYQLDKLISDKNKTSGKGQDMHSIYRLDINWLNTNNNVNIIKNNELPGHENHIRSNKTISNVKSYAEVVYKHLYNNIDLKWYDNKGKLEYDFVVHPGADYKQIKMQINGAENIRINTSGELEMETPLGTISEKAPFVTEEGKVLDSEWSLNGNIVSFNVKGHNPSKTMIIDPVVRVWGTYYGGTANDAIWSIKTDSQGNVYAAGQSNSATGTIIATTGAHQAVNGGAHDAFLAKFDENGVRQWATYFGGTGNDVARACTIDKISGAIYIGGNSSTTGTIMATPGAHQVNHGGSTNDAFVAKFSSAGVLQWSTYYGGLGEDQITGMAIDASGNIYASGITASAGGTIIASTGAHQTVHGGNNDAFLVKFNTNGVRQWGTYYGGVSEDRGYACDVDPSGNAFLFGDAVSNTGTIIATAGSHQTAHGGGYDAFIAKFNTSGVRQWGTYYGGLGLEFEPTGRVDNNGNVYLNGYTDSNTGTVIATPGTHAPTYMGSNTFNNSYLVKFNNNGVRLWGTYHGSAFSHDYPAKSFDVDENGYIYFGGFTQSAGTDGYSTTGSHQMTNAGGDEGFIVAFRPNGTKAWGTYYGGTANEQVWTLHYNKGSVYIGGQTSTSGGTAIASTGAHQTVYNGGAEGFMGKFVYDATALRFDNIDDQVNTGTGMNTLLVGNNKLSVEAWVKPTSASGLDCIIGNYSTPNNQMQFLLRKENMTNYRLWIGNSALASYTSVSSGTVAPVLNEWQHVAGTFDGTVASIYINGALTGTTLINLAAFAPSSNSVIIGANGINENFGGDIDEIRVWNRTLCQGEIMNNMNTELSLPQNGLLAYYKFNQGIAFTNNSTVTVVTDAGPNALNGTIFNSALTGTLSNWINTGAVAAEINAPTFVSPTIAVSGSTLICSGNSTTLTASGNVSTYNWINGPTTATNAVSPSVTTTYSVTGTNSLGCVSNMATRTVSVNTTPTVSVNNGTICPGNPFTIVPSGASTYTIQGGNTVVTPSTSTSYTVRGTSAAGCISANTATSNVTVNPNPTISVNNGTVCTGNSFTINPSGAATYTIQGGNAVVSPTTNASYTVVGTSSAGCLSSNTATSNVTVNALPTVSANNGTICAGNSFTIIPSGAATYTIEGGNAVVSPTTNASYTVVGTSSAGCLSSNTATSNVNVNPTPSVTAVSNSSLLCIGQSATLTANGAASYTWNTASSNTSIVVSPTATTVYTVTGSDANGCENTAVISQSVSACTGINESIDKNSFVQIYPNPASNVLNVKLSGFDLNNTSVKITNILGQDVINTSVNSDLLEMNLTEMPNGLYFVRILVNNKEVVNHKLIKQ